MQMAHYRNPHTVTLCEPPTSTENPHLSSELEVISFFGGLEKIYSQSEPFYPSKYGVFTSSKFKFKIALTLLCFRSKATFCRILPNKSLADPAVTNHKLGLHLIDTVQSTLYNQKFTSCVTLNEKSGKVSTFMKTK